MSTGAKASAMSPHHTVAIYLKHDTGVRVLVDSIECDASQAPEVALDLLRRLVTGGALIARVITTNNVTDV